MDELFEGLSITSSASSSSSIYDDAVDSSTDEINTVPAPATTPILTLAEAPGPYTNYLSLVSRTIGDESPGVVNQELVHQLKTAPIFSGAVHDFVEHNLTVSSLSDTIYPQYGLLGMLSEDESTEQQPHNKLVFSNTEEPHSIFICGSQGSGKSHTLSCLLENALLQKPEIGNLKTPLSAMVFHYDGFSNFSSGQVCEAAYLCSVGVPVRVLVAPTSLNRMTKQYGNLPGVPDGGPKPKVMPLYFSQEQLSVDTMMTLMAVHDTGTSAPLYVCAIAQILREIALNYQDQPGFNYGNFRDRLARLELVQGQSAPLNMRLALLESVLLEEKQTDDARKAYQQIWTFEPGTLTIVDLSGQFVNEQDACALFSICLKLFMDGWKNNPRIIALDEAHKLLNVSTESTQLTSDLIAIIRQQRHLSSRVIVATQEPTVSGALLDLCNVTIVHRFNSPKWYSTLRAHLAGANASDKGKDGLFQEVVQLKTGEALIFCPTAVLSIEFGKPQPLRDSHAKVQVRDRVSADGGQSILPSHQVHVHGNSTAFDLKTIRRFDSSRLPAPGSLALKGKRYMNGNGSASDGFPVSSTTGTNGHSSLGQSALHKRAASTEQQPQPQPQPQQRQAPSRATGQIAIAASNKYRDMVTEEQVRDHMYAAIRRVFGKGRPPKDPMPYFDRILKIAAPLCNRGPTYLLTNNIMINGNYVSPMEVLKEVLKRYYDDKAVPNNDRQDLAWLKE